MNPENDNLLSRLVVRIEKSDIGSPIGSGILFSCPRLPDSIYILTAAHCLYEDKEKLEDPRPEVVVCLFNPVLATYQSITVTVNHDLVSKSLARDVAVIILKKTEVEAITGSLPALQAIKERHSNTSFVLKGFPSATKGKEVVLTKPEFVQDMVEENKFQLRLTDDFTTDTSAESKVDGFSGSGIFLESHNNLYLFGIFTRFREAQKIIYCQYIKTINELLSAAFLPTIPFTYIGEHGLTPDFLAKYNANAIKNLGPRFSEQLNLRLPIVYDFHDAAKDGVFRRRLLRLIDEWLLHHNYSAANKKEGILAKIANEVTGLKQSIIKWYPTIQWEANKPIDLAPLLTGLDTLEQHIDTKQSELYELQREELQKRRNQGGQKKENYGYEPEPYETELRWLWDTQRAIFTLKSALKEVSIALANSPILIIKGEPGSGKSHLLGDITPVQNVSLGQ